MHQVGCLGRTLGCASGEMLGKDGGNVHQDRGFGKDIGMCIKTGDSGCVKLPALGRRSHSRTMSYRDLSCPWLVCGEEYFICTTEFKWLLLDHYWRLIVGSICFNFSHRVGVAEEGSRQQREVLDCFASHTLLLFY